MGLPDATLENDAANPCVGCGPGNPRGLRLRFERRGDAVVSRLAAEPSLQGWPGRLHSGVLYLALLEVANWTVYGLLGRVGLPVRTGALELRRWVAVGEGLDLEGRAPAPEARPLAVEARALDPQGREVARLERGYEFPGRREFMARMGYDRLPEVLAGLVPEG